MSYIARRLGFYLVAAWASLTLNFFLPRLMPGDPSIAIFARFHGQLNPAALRRGLHHEDPEQIVFGIDEEEGAADAVPTILAERPYCARRHRGAHGEAEAVA